MSIVYMFLILFSYLALLSYVKILNLGHGLTEFTVISLFLLVIFLLALVQSKDKNTKEDAND